MPPEHAYEVGYGKPPQHSRFRKGQCGNPRGRPKGSKNLATIVGEALDQKVVVNEGGRRRKITKREAVITQLVNRSAQADLKATQMLLGLMHEIERRGETASAEAKTFSDKDRQVLAVLRARLAGDTQGDDDARA
jgi:Family of unknown function (DUF5681)